MFYLARQQVRERGAWAPAKLTDNDPLHDQLTKEFGPILKTLLPHQQEIARRTTARYLRLARVTVAEHPHRVYFVFPTTTGPEVLVLPSQKRTWQLTAVVLGALAFLALVPALRPAEHAASSTGRARPSGSLAGTLNSSLTTQARQQALRRKTQTS